MVKRITVYTAFGQFLQMVERQAEIEKEQMKEQKMEVDTDNYPLDHPLSDYQNALNSVHEVKSCPVQSSDPVVVPIKKSASCPIACFVCQQDPTPMVISPVPTSIETRKLNQATELMMSFWKVHVTRREEQIPSLFEKMEGLFSNPSSTSVVSLFGKFEDLFEEMMEGIKESGSNTDELMWTSPDQPSFPQLPVFVKSPIDSLKIYKGSQHTEEMADDELTLTSSTFTHRRNLRPPTTTSSSCSWTTAHPSSSSSSSSSMTIISKPHPLLMEVRLQRAVIDEQKKIIDSLYSLQMLNQKLAKLHQD